MIKDRYRLEDTLTTGFWIAGFILVSILIYTAFGVTGKVPLNWVIFAGFLVVLVALNIALGALFVRKRSSYSLHTQMAVVLWEGFIIWYWIFAPIYYYLIINADTSQVRWIAFGFIWIISLAGPVFIGAALRIFQPVKLVIEDSAASINSIEQAYKRTIRYPIIVAFLQLILVIVSTGILVWILRVYAAFPVEEQLKTVLYGLVISVFLGAFYYLFLDIYLGDVRASLKRKQLDEGDALFSRMPRISIWKKLFFLVFSVSAGGMLLMGLIVFQSWQDIIDKYILIQIRSDIQKISQDIQEASTRDEQVQIIQRFQHNVVYGENGKIFFLNAFQELSPEEYSEEVRQAIKIQPAGILKDFHGQRKILMFFTDVVSGSKIVSIAYPADFRGTLAVPAQFFFTGSLFVLILISVMSMLLGKIFTRSLRIFASSVQNASSMKEVHIHTADELEDLARALSRSTREANMLRMDLEYMVREKTSELMWKTEELKEKNLALQEIHAKNATLLESIGEGVIAADMDGHILFMNRVAEEIIGFSFAEIRENLNIVHDLVGVVDEKGESIPYEKQAHVQAMKTAVPVIASYTYVRKDGSSIPIRITASPIMQDNQVVGVMGVFHDITKEQEIDRAKSEFVSLASHQLRTPISIINWYAEALMGGRMAEKLEARQERFVGEIYNASRRMAALVNAILEVAKMEMGTLYTGSIEQVTDLVELCKRVLEDLAPDIEAKHFDIHIEYDAVPRIKADPRMLEIIFQNIISNAVRYTPQEGCINIYLIWNKKNQTIIFKVTDTGYGIPAEDKERIFTKMYRAQNVKGKETEGTGLGLYMVKSLVERLGGSIDFESEEGQGTTFTIELPVIKQ